MSVSMEPVCNTEQQHPLRCGASHCGRDGEEERRENGKESSSWWKWETSKTEQAQSKCGGSYFMYANG